MKVGLCSMIRHENRYLKEWIEYYRNIGVDHIILGDNNDIVNDEDVQEFVDANDYSDYVTVIDIKQTNISKTTVPDQLKFFNDVYNSFGDRLDWIAYFDIDEFFTIVPKFCENNIKTFISTLVENAKMNFDVNADQLFIGQVIYGDNGNIFYEDKPVLERFDEISSKVYTSKFNNLVYTGKCIVKTNRPATFTTPHNASGIDGYRFISVTDGGFSFTANLFEGYAFHRQDAFLKHFYSRSLEEFLTRRCFDQYGFDPNDFDQNIDNYFSINKKTLEKIKFAELYKKLYENNLV